MTIKLTMTNLFRREAMQFNEFHCTMPLHAMKRCNSRLKKKEKFSYCAFRRRELDINKILNEISGKNINFIEMCIKEKFTCALMERIGLMNFDCFDKRMTPAREIAPFFLKTFG